MDNSRTLMRFDWQGHEAEVTGYSDSDWAGCSVTGKSTSGGALVIGHHLIKCWSRTEKAEAELVAIVKCSAELLGLRSLMMDLGRDSNDVIYADHYTNHHQHRHEETKQIGAGKRGRH